MEDALRWWSAHLPAGFVAAASEWNSISEPELIPLVDHLDAAGRGSARSPDHAIDGVIAYMALLMARRRGGEQHRLTSSPARNRK